MKNHQIIFFADDEYYSTSASKGLNPLPLDMGTYKGNASFIPLQKPAAKDSLRLGLN